MVDAQPVASTSRVTLDLYGQAVSNGGGGGGEAAADAEMNDSATEVDELEERPVAVAEEDDDQEGEIDEESSDEEALQAVVQKRQGQARRMEAVQGLYPGEQVLPDEGFGAKTVAEIYAMLEGNVINLSPDYQRDVVWPETQAAGLIESLLRNMHVPEILFNTYTPVPEDLWYTVVKAKSRIRPEGNTPLPAGFDETWTADEVENDPKLAAALAKGDLVPRDVWNCADGKQRMSSIKRFMRGEFQVTGEDGTRYTYSSLPPQARKVLDSKRMRYGFYRDLSDAQEREIFRRVQLGKALDKGEIMNAITSPYADWVHEIKDDLFSQRPEKIARSLKPRLVHGPRGTALQAAYSMSKNLLVPIDQIKFESDAIRSRNMASSEPPPRHKQREVSDALRRFVELTLVKSLDKDAAWPATAAYRKLREHNVPVPHRVWRLRPGDVKGHEHKKQAIAFAPIELHLLPAVVKHFDDLPDGDLLELVFRLRKHLHETFPGEMKDNNKLYNAVKEWVAEFDTSTLRHKYKDDGTLRKKGESSTPVYAGPQKRRLPREGPENAPTSAKKRVALDLTGSDDTAPSRRSREDDRPAKSTNQSKQRSDEPRPHKDSQASQSARAAPRPPAHSSSSGSNGVNGSRSDKAPAPPRHPPPPPPAQPDPGPVPSGLSRKQEKFNFTVAAGTNGFSNGGNRGSNASSSQSRSAILGLPSSKRTNDRPQFDERGCPILANRSASVQPGVSENDASVAFHDQADDDMRWVTMQKQQGASWSNGYYDGRAGSSYGTADPAIGMPPPTSTTTDSAGDQQFRDVLKKKSHHSRLLAPMGTTTMVLAVAVAAAGEEEEIRHTGSTATPTARGALLPIRAGHHEDRDRMHTQPGQTHIGRSVVQAAVQAADTRRLPGLHILISIIRIPLELVGFTVRETAHVAEAIIQFLFHNFFSLGFLAALFVGFVLYRQNQGQIKARAQNAGKKRA
ncbi:hypothetical protein JCM10908_004252 [Rhodotorula pacifica]|uniref:DUF262 domain-containing protein n=1 Tax=Rhodotorula pacifica TaxID=1495444 RepID=UPI0031735E30